MDHPRRFTPRPVDPRRLNPFRSDPRRFTLPAFLLLLALVFTASYAVGSWAGPVAPGMHGPRPATGDDTEEMPGMGGMHG